MMQKPTVEKPILHCDHRYWEYLSNAQQKFSYLLLHCGASKNSDSIVFVLQIFFYFGLFHI